MYNNSNNLGEIAPSFEQKIIIFDPDPVGSGNGYLPGCHLVYGEDVLPAEEQPVADGPGQGSHQAVLYTKCCVFFCYLPV
jgi:hypothetical protein